MHIDKFNNIGTGKDKHDEREFLAFEWEVFATEKPGTGKVRSPDRVCFIDVALGYFYCLSGDLQNKYADKKNNLLRLRPVLVEKVNKLRKKYEPITTTAPTTCTRPFYDRRRGSGGRD
jgi:hypothetical protein